MDDRTARYLKGRFSDYYRGSVERPGFIDGIGGYGVREPRVPGSREWGYVLFEGGMVRHKSLIDIGDLDRWLVEVSPLHVYYSSARYQYPGANRMEDKEWMGADLIFDLDADHLRGVDEDTAYVDMLSRCKDALLRLLGFLREDFGFSDLEVVFSGSRGYHVHVFDEGVIDLDSDARREVVDYIRGIGFQGEYAFRAESAGGSYGTSDVKTQKIREGRWGERIRRYILDFRETVLEMDEDEAMNRLMEFSGVGESKAEKALDALKSREDEIRTGNMDVKSDLRGFWEVLAEKAVHETGAETDEPVTTDTRRLIRLRGSLHGGTGFQATPLEIEEIERFDPLSDALVFSERTQSIEVDESHSVYLGDRVFELEPGVNDVPEFVAVYAMLRLDAELG